MNAQQSGKLGENAACVYLKKKRYAILARNYRKRFGEIDIIAQRKSKIVFVEVKTRSGAGYGMPSEAVDYYKQQKIIKTAQSYLLEHRLDGEIAFDVIEVLLSGGKVLSVNHIENAFIT